MPFDFPSPGTEGLAYNPAGGPQYVYTDGAWRMLGNPTVLATAEARNRIVNGAMQVSQENGNTASAVAAYYIADQFHDVAVTAAPISVQRVQSVTPNGSKDRIRFAATTGAASVLATYIAAFSTRIEGNRVADFRWGTASAKQAILRFGWKSPAGTYSVSLQNTGQARSYVVNFTISAGQANTDTEQIFIVPGDTTGTWLTDTGVGIYMFIAMVVGTDRQGVAGWQAGEKTGTSVNSNGFLTTGNTFELFDVGLYLDPDATGVPPKWTMPDEAEELRACMRYWQPLVMDLIGYGNAAGGFVGSQIMFPVVPRTTPALTSATNGVPTNATAAVFDSPRALSCRALLTAAAVGTTAITGRTGTANARM